MLSRHVRSAAAGAALLVLAAPALAAPMTFRNVEFLPSQQRLAAAQSLLANAAPAGTPLAEAQRRMGAAGARCRPAKEGDGVRCEYTTLEHPTGNLTQDIVWSVRLVPDGSGRVASSSVTRDIYGV